MRKILITGSRDWTDSDLICAALRHEFGKGRALLIHGACPSGADSIARLYCLLKEYPEQGYPADWDTHGKAAGPKRNQQMVDLNPDICLVFAMPCSKVNCSKLPRIHMSHGTNDCMRRAEKAEIPIRFFSPVKSLVEMYYGKTT